MAIINGVSDAPVVDVSLATVPSDLSSVPALLEDIKSDVDNLAEGDDERRREAAQKARALLLALQTPRETMVEHCWAQGTTILAITFGVDTGLWKLMAKNGDQPQKVDDLAPELGVDPVLLNRLLRHLSALGHLHETGPGAYRPTAFTRSLAHPLLGDGYRALAPLLHGAQTFHEHSRARGHADPVDPHDTALQEAMGGTGLLFFPYLVRRGLDGWFNHHMGGYKLGCRLWMRDYFPVRERLFGMNENAHGNINGNGNGNEDVNGNGKRKRNEDEDVNENRKRNRNENDNGHGNENGNGNGEVNHDDLFLVDLGGGLGHELSMFKKMFPDHPGRLVLHDLPPVIEKIVDLDGSIERIPYDMTSDGPPVKGARAYFMHSVLHIWPDSICQKALGNIKSAMVPGYSKLLINDHVTPESDAYWETSALDLLMMSFHAARERTVTEWYHLLEEVAGFRIVKIWDGGKGNESLIECEVPL